MKDSKPGDRLVAIRKMKSMSQSEMAGILKISQPYLSVLEKNHKTPSETILELLIYRFGLRREWVYDGTGHPFIEEGSLERTDKKLTKREELERDLLVAACVIGPILPIVSGGIAVGVSAARILSKLSNSHNVSNASALAEKLGVNRSTLRYWISTDKIPERIIREACKNNRLKTEDLQEADSLIIVNKIKLKNGLNKLLRNNGCKIDDQAIEEIISKSSDLAESPKKIRPAN